MPTISIRNEQERIGLKNLKGFAVENQVGLVAIIARDGIRVLDPISGGIFEEASP